jgi:hypothetical protein
MNAAFLKNKPIGIKIDSVLALVGNTHTHLFERDLWIYYQESISNYENPAKFVSAVQ